jgi:hypothetical protein
MRLHDLLDEFERIEYSANIGELWEEFFCRVREALPELRGSVEQLNQLVELRTVQKAKAIRMLYALREDIAATIDDPPKETLLVIAELRVALMNSNNLQKLLGVEM